MSPTPEMSHFSWEPGMGPTEGTTTSVMASTTTKVTKSTIFPLATTTIASSSSSSTTSTASTTSTTTAQVALISGNNTLNVTPNNGITGTTINSSKFGIANTFVVAFPPAPSDNRFDDEPWREFPPWDGFYNNLALPSLGSVDSPMLHLPPSQYADGVKAPAGADRPNPRTLSLELMGGQSGLGNAKGKTVFMTFFAEQVVHEIVDTQRPHCPIDHFNIAIPAGDPLFDPTGTGKTIIPLARTRYDAASGLAINSRRAQMNEITPWIDGGVVYGTSRVWSNALRSHVNGTLLADNSGKFPAFNNGGLPLANPAPPRDHVLKSPFRSHRQGNTRGNETPMLLSMGTLWFREHNFQAARLKVLHPDWDDERLFNEARRWVIALYQKVVTEEWFPVFTGRQLPSYKGYDPRSHPQIATIFHAAAMRYGHTLVPPAVWRRTVGFADPNNSTAGLAGSCHFLTGKTFRTCNSYWNPNEYLGANTMSDFLANASFSWSNIASNNAFNGAFVNGSQTDLDAFLLGMTAQITEREDNIVVEDLRGFAYGPLEMSRRDLMAINIQRGREEGLPDYNTARRFFNLATITSFQNITGDWDVPVNGIKPVAKRMEELYGGNLNDIDVWVGGLLETTGGEMGDLFAAVLTDQFTRIRDADRFWFANPSSGYFTPAEIAYIRSSNNSMRAIIIRNTGIPDWALQQDVWHAPPSEFYCHQPGQINGTDAVDSICTPPQRFDYLTLSGYQITAVIVASLMLALLALATVPLAKWWRSLLIKNAKSRRKMVEDQSRKERIEVRESAGGDLTDTFFATEFAGRVPTAITTTNGETPQPDSVDLSMGTDIAAILMADKIRLVKPNDFGKVLRDVPYERFGDVMQGKLCPTKPEGNVNSWGYTRRKWLLVGSRADPEVPEVVIKVPKEYDIWLRFSDAAKRDEFIHRLLSLLDTAGLSKVPEVVLRSHRELKTELVSRAQWTTAIGQFFREIAHIVAPQKGDSVTGTTDRSWWKERTKSSNGAMAVGGLAQAELSRDEFAAAFRIDKHSLFATQIFNRVDRDRNGYAQFTELLDMMVIFNSGNVEAKIRLLFDLHDLDADGMLSRGELVTMLTSLLNDGSTGVEVGGEAINDASAAVVDSWWEEIERHRGGSTERMSFEDFRHALNVFGENIILTITETPKFALNDSTNIAVSPLSPAKESFDFPLVHRSTSQIIELGRLSSTTSVMLDQPPTSSIRNRRLSQSVSRGLSTLKRSISRRGSFRLPETRTLERTVTEVLMRSQLGADESSERRSNLAYWRTYLTNKRREILFILLFVLSTVGIFFERFYVYYYNKEHGGLRQITGFGVSITRGAASGQMWAYAWVLLSMCQNTIVWLRQTWLVELIPFDSHLQFHILAALTGLLMSLIHIVGHFFNFYNLSTQSSDDMLCYFRDVYHHSDELLSYFYYCWQSVTGFSGIVLVILMILIYTFSHNYVRRNAFTVFWMFHQLHPIWYLAMCVHGAAQLVQPPYFWYFILIPLVVYRLDSVFSAQRRAYKVAILESALLPSDVTFLKLKKPTNFEYKAGQWFRMSIPDISAKEFHPFTLSSAPNDPFLSVHVRTVGPWTTQLRDRIWASNQGSVLIDGPFGGGFGDYSRYPVAVFVGGGIGVTPFASIMKELVFNGNIAPGILAQQRIRKAYFIWITRSQKQFEWMVDVIKELEERDVNRVLETHIFITAIAGEYDLQTTMLYITERSFERMNGKSLFTGLRSRTHFGRPSFDTLFREIREIHSPAPASESDQVPVPGKDIGVFSCGPAVMMDGIALACAELNREQQGHGYLHHFGEFFGR